MKKLTGFYPVYILTLFLFGCSDEDEPDFARMFTFEPNKIECQFCVDFGWRVEVAGNEVFVADDANLYVFEDQNGNFSLKQEITGVGPSGIYSVLFHENFLYLGVALYDGTGKVIIYQKSAGLWQEVDQLQSDRSEDNFGSSIDIYENYMVVGASVPWSSASSDIQDFGEGRIYIYQRDGATWQLQAEFRAEMPSTRDYFGETVAVYEDYVFAGSQLTPMHVYQRDQQWELIKVDTITPAKIDHLENKFVIRNGAGYTPQLLEFELESDGSYELNDTGINFFPAYDLSTYGEMFDLYGSHLITWIEGEEAILLSFLNNQWQEQSRFQSPDGHFVLFAGLEITDSHIYLAGRDNFESDFAYLYKVTY